VATLRVSHVGITRVLSMLRSAAARPTRPPTAAPTAPTGSIRRQFYIPNDLRGKIHQEFTAPALLGPGAA